MNWTRGEYTVTTDRTRMSLDTIHGFLSQSYWSPGIPKELVAKAMENSVAFAVLAGAETVGYARVITDRATYGYLADVFVLEEHRGRGLSKFLLECIDQHPDLQGLRRWQLVTRDAHGLYGQFGYVTPKNPERHMERVRANPYRQPT